MVVGFIVAVVLTLNVLFRFFKHVNIKQEEDKDHDLSASKLQREYEMTLQRYMTMKKEGKLDNNSNINNNR